MQRSNHRVDVFTTSFNDRNKKVVLLGVAFSKFLTIIFKVKVGSFSFPASPVSSPLKIIATVLFLLTKATCENITIVIGVGMPYYPSEKVF